MKKSIAFLIESELEKAEAILAAKSITDAIQKTAETIAKMEADDVIPLNDTMRELFGPDAASKFNEAVSNKLRELVQNISDAKNFISDEIARLQGEMPAEPSDLASMDDKSFDLGDNAINEPASDEETPADNEEPSTEEPATDEKPKFDDLDFSGNSEGRMRKESFTPRRKMIEGADLKVANEYVSMIKEGKSPKVASGKVMERYGIDIHTLIGIMEVYKG